MKHRIKTGLVAFALGLTGFAQLQAQEPNASSVINEVAQQPWMNSSLSAEARTELVLKEMTLDEKLTLVFGYFGTDSPWRGIKRPPESLQQSAGFVYGIPRLGIPHSYLTDAGVGVASQRGEQVRERTALPAGINAAAAWDPQVAFAGGVMIGAEARTSGFNVLLAGGLNLVRDPRNGRNFEYAGEDPLLAGMTVGAQIRGIQSQHIVSTLKHLAFNHQETGRFVLNAKVDDTGARMSELLGLQIAFEQGNPGSVMCAYNRVNGVYACESDYLLNEVLKNDWGFKGYVMSDWGATHSTVPAANNGLDQQSGYPFDQSAYFKEPLKEAVMNGWVPQARMDDMARRVLYPMFAQGVIDNPLAAPSEKIDFAAHATVTQAGAEAGMVLLKNSDKLLPLSGDLKKIAVIGGHADVGVLSGGGSSQVYPRGGMAIKGLGPKDFPGPMVYFPSSPLKALQAQLPKAQVSFNAGTDLTAAARLAAESDLVIVFANQWAAESIDLPNLSLPDNQDDLIAAVAKANAKTVVVLQTGGPITMPWLGKVGAVLEAWYPGTQGGEAIARVLTGKVNPSGHLPVSFPASLAQVPRPVLDGYPEVKDKRFDVDYFEGAAIGYKWLDLKGHTPLFPFGFGLSYTDFAYSNLQTQLKNDQLMVSFNVKNTGALAGKDVAQVYVSPKSTKWEAPKRLVAFQKVDLQPGETKQVELVVDSRLLAMYHSKDKTWRVTKGDYNVMLSQSAAEPVVTAKVRLPKQTLDVRGN